MESSNTEPSGPVIHLNTIKSGTQPQTSKMPNMQGNDSTNDTPRSPVTINFEKQKNGETWVTVSRAPTPTSPPFCPLDSPPPPVRCSRPEMSWTACTEDACQTHLRDKEGAYFPQPRQRSKSAAVPSEWEQTCEVQPPATGPSGFSKETPTGPKETSGVHQRKKEQHGRTHWTKCYRDGCWQHKEEKTKNRHYPRRPVPGEKVVRGWGKDARTRPWGEGSEKTQPDTEAYQRQIQELLEERDKDRKTIADLETNVVNQRRTIASSTFMLGRAENEVRTLRRAIEKYEVLRSDVRRAGRKLLDLGN